uniref:Phospholipid-transporting ATPase n=1 Tax=Arcella intermedia TaxID=1963864 RepID=A0A6B2KWI1_9EUKA
MTEFVITANDLEANHKYKYPSNELNTTKYTAITFVPRFLYEQFRRLPNLYFLIVAIITCVPNVSPISPVSAVLPFVLIILTAAVKEAFEDFRRWQSDKEINNRLYEVFREGREETTTNMDIKVGDVVHLKENQEVPADVVLFTSSENEGICYVDTANLDGETNLKLFKSLPETSKLTPEDMLRVNAVIRAQPPNEKLYDFKANLVFSLEDKIIDNPIEPPNEDDLLSLGKSQLLMRGVRIRNTKHVYGVVVYTGKNTKLALNAVSPPSKFSQTERAINMVSLGIFVVYIILVSLCTILSYFDELSPIWYAPLTDAYRSFDAGVVFMAYFVLLGYFIPISLFVNLELLKLIQAGWMMGDDGMSIIDGESSRGMRVKNSNLNDELSRVSYIFSDKTGTLTQNKMIFDQCSVGGKKYPEAGKGGLKKLIDKNKEVREFLLNMALNNEVLPEDKGDNVMPKYAAPSPDEIALVKGAYENGVQFRSRSNAGIEIVFKTNTREPNNTVFEILNTFEFSSERKRSSVIVKADDNIIMYTKGADSVMKPRLNKTDGYLETHLGEYSREGLRTLVFARKHLSPEEYKRFNKLYTAAANSIQNREQQLEKVMNEMEQELDLQGCSAIQDALQEEVPFTIAYLVKAGIKVWMITGDQQDTAENIGYSCKLVTKLSELVRVVKCDNVEKAEEALNKAKATLDRAKMALYESKKGGKKGPEYPHVTLVIDGQSLVWALTEELAPKLLEVGRDCETVIVCRADPLQKALVVRLMKRGTKKITLSIGDGANDVSMLQEAHIGVGIWGEEGSQAANNSDYAIRLFKHLAKLVTVHGRYNMMRTAVMVEYSFYKNLALFATQFWFAIFCRWSAQTFFDDWVMSAYNVAILSLPPLSLAIFEKDIKEEVIFKFPETYRELRGGLYFTSFTFGRWMISAFLHSIVIYFTIFFLPDVISSDGKSEDLLIISTIAASTGVFAILGKALVATRHWVWPSYLAYILSIVALFGLLLIESALPTLFPKFYMIMNTTMSLGYYWFLIIIVFAICIIPEVCFEFIQRSSFPYYWQIVQERMLFIPEGDEYVDQDLATLNYTPSDGTTVQEPEVAFSRPPTLEDTIHLEKVDTDKSDSGKQSSTSSSEEGGVEIRQTVDADDEE